MNHNILEEYNHSWAFISFNYDIEHSYQFEQNMLIRNYHTDILDDFSVKSTNYALALISTRDGQITHLGVFRKGSKIASKKYRVKIIKAVPLHNPISLEYLSGFLSSKFANSIKQIFSSESYKFPKEFRKRILSIITENNSIKEQYFNLIKEFLIKQDDKVDNGQLIKYTEREAIDLALRISGLNTKYREPFKREYIDTPSFLKGLSELNIREDLFIQNDSRKLDDWMLLKEDILSAFTFTNGMKEISIMYVNRTSIENNIGVDLLYIDESAKSYIMVQYKRMVKEGAKFVYRPTNDSSYEKEIDLMNKFSDVLSKTKKGDSVYDYRYNDELFYFKLCKNIQNIQEDGLSKGLYIPKDYWEKLIKSERTIGDRGGRLLTYDNVERYLNNTTFINLVKTGLVGSQYKDFDLITRIINEILISGKSLILAQCNTR